MLSDSQIQAARAEFPALNQRINNQPLVYLDNAATTHKPQVVIDAVQQFYQQQNANVHRGIHTLSDTATNLFEQAREQVRGFINAQSIQEIIWTSGTTESINLVAHSFGAHLTAKDSILISAMEHHANIVPWQLLQARTGVRLNVIPMNEQGELEQSEYSRLLDDSVKLVAITQVSNSLGTINPVAKMIQQAHQVGAKVLVDGAQAVAHMPTDVQALNADFFCFSGHKLFAPTGIGVLYGKQALLESMPPFKGGGEMIKQVSFTKTSYNTLPFKFEAGTPPIAQAIGLGVAIDYLSQFALTEIGAHEQRLLKHTQTLCQEIPELQEIGQAQHKAGIFSFTFKGAHPEDVGTLLDQQGIAIRTGHHCTMPVMQHFNIAGTARAAFSFYNNLDDVNAFIAGLHKARTFLA